MAESDGQQGAEVAGFIDLQDTQQRRRGSRLWVRPAVGGRLR